MDKMNGFESSENEKIAPVGDMSQRQAIKETRTESLRIKDIEAKEPEHPWGFYDSEIYSFNHTFENVLGPDFYSLEDYLVATYKDRLGTLIGIEIGGPGSKLFGNLHHKGIFKKTAGITLNDLRPTQNKRLDKKIGHTLIEADVFSSTFKDISGQRHAGWQEVEKWIEKNGKADFIIERMIGGINQFDKNPEQIRLFALNLLRWYKILNSDGSMFIEFPLGSEVFLPQIQTLTDNHIETRFAYEKKLKSPVLKIRRLPGSPDRLEDILKQKTTQ